MRQYTKKYIQELLDRYMDGTTTLDEEDVLASYFQGHDIPQEWEAYRQLFQEIETMRPQESPLQSSPVGKPKASRHWLRWSAAAVVAGILFAAVLWHRQPTLPAQPAPLTAQSDTASVLPPAVPHEVQKPDSTAHRKQPQRTDQPRKSRRKVQPTIHDYDRAYALMAQAEEECRQVEQQIAEAQQEVLHVKLTAAGFSTITLEDGTIIYIDEPKEYFAYEE